MSKKTSIKNLYLGTYRRGMARALMLSSEPGKYRQFVSEPGMDQIRLRRDAFTIRNTDTKAAKELMEELLNKAQEASHYPTAQ